MATLKIEINATTNAFNKYADNLGYQPKVFAESTGGEDVFVDNPQSKAEYLAESVKRIVSSALADAAATAVKRQKIQEATTERANLEDQIANAITITVS